jgi:hypothetical protein
MAGNAPAVRLYTSLGFHPTDAQSVFLWQSGELTGLQDL